MDRLPINTGPGAFIEERLERGEIVYFDRCPFALPEGDDLQFLMAQRHSRWAHKNICYHPGTGQVTGFRKQSTLPPERLRALMAEFSQRALAWMTKMFPRYATGWQVDRATLRPEEEATRRLRLTARNDLLHVDAFPTRPSRGRRILRLFANINPVEPRVWVTSEEFAQLLARFGATVGLPDQEKGKVVGWSFFSSLMSRFLQRSHSDYDRFMLRLHHFLKTNDEFQERGPKRFWHFAPGSAWLVFTDGVAYAEARGQHALEHSFFIVPETLALPEQAPAALLARSYQSPGQAKAA